MPFPSLPVSKHFANGGTSPREEFYTDEQTGITLSKVVPCNEQLPPADYFKIDNLIKAGVTLNEVNTKVIVDENPITINANLNNTVERIKSSKSKSNEENE